MHGDPDSDVPIGILIFWSPGLQVMVFPSWSQAASLNTPAHLDAPQAPVLASTACWRYLAI